MTTYTQILRFLRFIDFPHGNGLSASGGCLHLFALSWVGVRLIPLFAHGMQHADETKGEQGDEEHGDGDDRKIAGMQPVSRREDPDHGTEIEPEDAQPGPDGNDSNSHKIDGDYRPRADTRQPGSHDLSRVARQIHSMIKMRSSNDVMRCRDGQRSVFDMSGKSEFADGLV